MAASAGSRRIKPPTRGLTAAEVDALVAEAIADVDECLISPLWGAMNPGGTLRHLQRFVRVMGLATRGAAYGKIFLSSIGVSAGLFALMSFNSTFGMVGDFVWSALFGIPLGFLGTGYFAYKTAFARITVDEHRNFTDPDHVTAQVNAWTDRLAHYHSHAWRGDNEANGIANPNSALYYQLHDRPVWLEEGESVKLPNGRVIEGPQLIVYPARKAENFREMNDYMGLTPQVFDVGGNSARDRRAARRNYSKPAQGMEEFERGKTNLLRDNLVWIYSIGCIVIAALVAMLAMD